MALMPDLDCMEPESYKKFFRALCWSGTRRSDKKAQRKGGKSKQKKKPVNPVAACYAPSLLGNPSNFAVYATVRRSILARWRHLQSVHYDPFDDSDNDEVANLSVQSKMPKITSIGLRTVFTLVSRSRQTDHLLCEHSLLALLDVLQGHAPEELSQEPSEVIANINSILIEIACGDSSGLSEIPSSLTATACSCLMALAVARGEAEIILNAVSSLMMSPATLQEQNVKVPQNLTRLQRSVQACILGPPSRNLWFNYGVPNQCLVNSFPVDLPPQLTTGAGELVVRSLVSDGCYLYIFSSKGLLKIGSGYSGSIKQYVYQYKHDFFASDRHGWLGYCKNKLYARIGRKKFEIFEIDKETLEVHHVIRLDPGHPAPIEPKSAVFSDGNQLGLIMLTKPDTLTIKMYDMETATQRSEGTSYLTVTSNKEMSVHLLRRRTLAIGRASFDDGLPRRSTDLDVPVAVQFDDNDDDPLTGLYAGQDFGLLTTASGKVFYSGKGSSLGYKSASPHPGKWTLMKETLFNRNDTPNVKKCKVVQVAVGHEGVHAIMVLDNGTALFTGVARRGEDGDSSKHRRTPKPIRPRKILKAEGHYIIYAACNYGSTALVTRQGLLLMFGKDTQHCDTTGLVAGLRHERVIQVALGKAHAVVLTSPGLVYTFGINNKGQCGREFGYTKEKPFTSHHQPAKEELPICPSTHTWTMDYCRVCVLCRECTGFASCQCAALPNRVPAERCGCGEGDAGCSVCGICRRCADAFNAANADPDATGNDDDDADISTRSDKENLRYPNYEGHTALSELDRDSSFKTSCLPPARVAVPGGHRCLAIACGLHHTVLLSDNGDVLAFGSNQYGQIGAGDIVPHHRIVRVRVPRATAIACGSNHTAVLTREGELYTFGSYQKGALGRPRMEEPARTDRSPIWYATPGRVARIGPRHACKAVWVTASGDETFVQVSQSLIKTDTLFSSTVTANSNSIVILPNRPEHTFKCITINKSDGTCNAWSGSEQVDFVNTLACLDPSYDVLWCYQPQMRVMKCYNILTFDSHILQRCCNTTEADPDAEFEYPHYGTMKRLEDFKNLENVDLTKVEEPKATDNVALSNMSILNQELAIPCSTGSSVTRMHGALHLLGCLDSLTYAHETKRGQVECKRDHSTSTSAPTKEDYLTVNRFESHGGGWGYSGQSMEAIRFMCDADILLGGLGLFGGRGEYTAKIKLFDIGPEGGDQENDGELIAESDEGIYECAPRDRYSVMFDSPVTLIAHRWYIAWACINGPSSDCGSSGQETVINDEIGFHFKTSKKSNNGTDVNAGQIPCLLYNVITPDHYDPSKNSDYGEVVVVLSKNISRKVTVPCFKYLITLLQHNWNIFKSTMLETNGQIPITYQKLQVMKHQKRLVYVIRACLRLVKVYVNEIYPPNHRKRQSYEYMAYFEAIGDVRNLIQTIMADATPTCTMLPRKPGKNKTHRVCYVQFALELASSILKEAHDTITSCYHAFYPTPTLKWRHLCKMLAIVKDGVVPASQSRELTSTCAALCVSKSLRDVLQYIVPVTQCNILSKENQKVDTRVQKDIPLKSATLPRYAHSSKPPPVPPRAHNKEQTKKPETEISDPGYIDWYLLDVLPKLLDIVLIPVKQQMMTRQCGQTHDHGEIKQQEQLAEFCCKLLTRIVAELSYSTVNTREDPASNMVQHLITPSRFMRVNQTRSWNTGNGSPDAICFYVDRPGVMLVGVCVYGGLGTYEYSLDLQTDVRMRSGNEEGNPAHCWVNVETVQGVFTAADCQHDVVQLKFDKPVPLKEDFRYAIRLCNHGGRTANGDCGLPSVRGPDGTTFRFASCSLSFNGTTLARGQIPNFIYYSTTKSLTNAPENTDNLISALRDITLRFASTVMERAADLFCTLRNELTAEDLRRNASVLQHSPAINVLIPFTLANLEGLADPKSIIKLLEMIHKLLPHVAAMNLLVPSAEETTTTTTQYYTCVESDHPYKQATVSNQRVLFPASVSWIVLEMDPRSMTAQPEDTLTVYASAGAPKHTCHCSNHRRANDQPFRRRVIELSSETSDVEDSTDEMNADAQCTHYNCSYVSVSAKLANVPAEWPQKALLIPGNEVVFSLETASDYLDEYYKNNDEDSRFGFRCLCVGYEDTPFTSSKQGLVPLEMELVHAGAACASRLLAPHLDITPLSFSTIVEVQLATTGPSSASEEDVRDTCETILLSRGLELSSPPSVHHVLEGQPLLRSVSTERQFLADFVSGAESTAGGRLARWLSPSSRVEPAKCHLKAPSSPVRPNVKINIPLLIRDQYGENVSCPALQVEVVVQRVDCKRQSIASLLDSPYVNLPNVAYAPSIRDNMCFTAITMMKVYQNLSFEELRFASGGWSGSWPSASATSTGRVPAERLPVRNQPDGTFVATWTPPAPGMYQFRCTLDDVPALHEMTVEVVESTAEGPLDRPTQSGSQAASQPCKMRRFVGRFSAGLRVRASPSLQAEELGIVPAGSNVYYVEEVVNIDGTWVRLGAESLRAFTDGGATVAWCIQHHRHHDCTLLVLAESSTPLPETTGGAWTGCGDSQGDMQSWNQEEDNGPETSSIYGRRMPVSSNNLESDSDSSSSPYVFGAEPTKRSRLNRRDNSANSSPIGRHYPRSNGNSGDDDWPHSNYNLKDACGDASETDIEPDAEHRSSSRLTPTATQTSPDSLGEEMLACAPLYSPANKALKHTSPSLPTRTAPAPPPPRTLALSPSQGECLRAIFAALLWHEGIVHDAIACAAFLKFHPNLPKQGTQVVTRASHGQAPVNQRHSVEVSNAGQYLHIHPSTLETLTRSGAEASASRARKTDINQPIKEEDSASISEPSPATVNVLPPALRALVAVWDALYDADQLSAATEKNMPDSNERNENEEVRPYGGCIRKKRDWKTTTKQVPRSVFCELCGRKGALPPIAAHMRFAHSGCNILANKGYDRAGVHRNLAHSPESNNYGRYTCGQIFKESYQVWYVYCDPCRDKQLKIVESMKPPKPADYGYETAEIFPDIDHHTMKENAMFLLDLAPLTNSEPMSSSPFEEVSRGSPVTPVGSLWQPAPAFQSLAALGAAPKGGMLADPARFHSLGRPMPAALPTQTVSPEPSTSQWPRMPRSVSMGQVRASARQSEPSKPSSMFTQDSQTDEDKLTGAGLSLLAQPSATLQKLVGCGAWDGNNPCTVSAFESPRVNPETIIGSPVLQFVLARRDLHAARQKMDAVVRINTVRQYAFEALTWLLRSATQPTCVHDVMWWFCVALDKFARIVPPPLALDDPKENAANESSRLVVPTASASSICPGGEAARGARAAFHAFLGSVSALSPSLPGASAAGLQAVRCWALHYSPHDRNFLHRSQVFSVISKILSHSEDNAYEENILGTVHESFHSYLNKENYVWRCADVTSWCDVTVSSRQGMAGSLTDGSTETFWESGDEDRNKAKWIQVAYPGGTPEDRPHIVCVHLDNTRDTMLKTVSAAFLYGAGGSTDLTHMQDVDIDPRSAAWLCYTLPRVPPTALRVRCELRGPEAAVRVRQIRVLSAPVPDPAAAASVAHILHSICEQDTLRVFRLLTSQVFGKLLEWERSGSDVNGEGTSAGDDQPANDSDLREHVVGILFAGNKLTSLQRQVMSHIVMAIGCEATRVRDDWETALLCAGADPELNDDLQPRVHTQDNYCFEMLSLLLALSGSSIGRAQLAQRTELLADLLTLLHTGSERVQRQVISLIRRMIMEVPPQKMLAAINYGIDISERVNLLDHLACYLAKAITLQTKVKGGGGSLPSNLMMGSSVTPAPVWYMRGETTKKHAHLVAKLLTDMAEGKISPEWALETCTALANMTSQTAQISEEDRKPSRCVALPAIWMTLAALTICEQSHLDAVHRSGSGRELRGQGQESGDDSRPFCTNHDDGTTLAVIECRDCGPLCSECDRFLHLNKSARAHYRKICKEEERAIRIDIHEGCGRAKLFWLLLLIDRRTLKALAEFRSIDTGLGDATPENAPAGQPGVAGVCRFCGARGNTGLLAIGNICSDLQCQPKCIAASCLSAHDIEYKKLGPFYRSMRLFYNENQEHGRETCNRVLGCGHPCGGVRGESTCLPCLVGCGTGSDEAAAAPLRQDADDMCMICFTDPLQAAPAIQLKCGHVFHLHCCKKVLANKWIGPRITFSFAQCPICKEDMHHWTLDELLTPIRQLHEEVRRKALMRLEYEGVAVPGSDSGASRRALDPAVYAMERYAYYVCHKCDKAYFGGLARCEAETSGWWEPEELVCGACSDVAGARICPKHGSDFLEYKCRYCCSVAVFFCFGTSHFCNACHDDFQRVTNIPKHLLPDCPAAPKGHQMPGTSEECPLHVQHPPTGEEFALGCGVCRHVQSF